VGAGTYAGYQEAKAQADARNASNKDRRTKDCRASCSAAMFIKALGKKKCLDYFRDVEVDGERLHGIAE